MLKEELTSIPHAVVVPSLSHVRLFATPWTAARPASLSLTIFWSLPKFISIELLRPFNHLSLFLLPSVFPSIRVFSNEPAVCIRWPKYWRLSFSISPSNDYSGLISFRIDWLNLLTTRRCSFTSKGLLRVFSSITIRKHHISGIQPSLWYKFHICTWLLKKTIALTTQTFDGKVVALFCFVLIWCLSLS